jgi:hypothetical protein
MKYIAENNMIIIHMIIKSRTFDNLLSKFVWAVQLNFWSKSTLQRRL